VPSWPVKTKKPLGIPPNGSGVCVLTSQLASTSVVGRRARLQRINHCRDALHSPYMEGDCGLIKAYDVQPAAHSFGVDDGSSTEQFGS
jgi:hypothetical protein